MSDQDPLDELHELSLKFQQAMAEMVKEQEEYWNSLTKEQQLDAFCCVARRIHDGEIIQKGSYRYVLYEVFGFGPEAYVPAQEAGYLTIHNSIFDADHDDKLLLAFCKEYEIEGAEEKISKFWKKGI